jgi:two-component system, NtrC family, C4-dicarboxylate transport response regulator DctD
VSAALARGLDGTEAGAPGAEQAIGMLATTAPDVVLSDVRMPGIGGLELLRLLKERAPGIDVILMTAHDDLPLVAVACGRARRTS